MSIDRHILDRWGGMLGQLLAQATKEATTLRTQADEAERSRAALEEFKTHLDKGWILHARADLEKNEALFIAAANKNPDLKQLFDETRSQAEQYRKRLPQSFPALLEEAVKTAALPVDRDSRHPRYGFEQGFFRIDVDDRKGLARISDHEGTLCEIPADVDAVVEIVQRERARVFERKFDAGKFLRKLWSNYRAVIQRDGLKEGSPVRIRQITRRLGKNEKGFRTDEFLIDLSRLVQQANIEIDGWRIELQHTKDTDQGMLLHGPAGSGYVGFITFRKV